MVTRSFYSIFLGILVALFVGWGIAAFYPAPVRPIFPVSSAAPVPLPSSIDASPSVSSTQAQQDSYNQKSQEYDQKTYPTYNRTVSILAMIGAILVLIISLLAMRTTELMSDGLLIGGVLIQLYSIGRSFLGQNNVYSFLTVAVGLAIALLLGYIKFIRPTAVPQSKAAN